MALFTITQQIVDEEDTITSCDGPTMQWHGALEWNGCIDNQCTGVTEKLEKTWKV